MAREVRCSAKMTQSGVPCLKRMPGSLRDAAGRFLEDSEEDSSCAHSSDAQNSLVSFHCASEEDGALSSEERSWESDSNTENSSREDYPSERWGELSDVEAGQ